MDICIDPDIETKLRVRHSVLLDEVLEAFDNRIRQLLKDTLPEHQTVPPTYWFCSTTKAGRVLKVVFVAYPAQNQIWIKTAYTPTNPATVQRYEQLARLR